MKMLNSKVALWSEMPGGKIDTVSQIHCSPLVLVGGHETEMKPINRKVLAFDACVSNRNHPSCSKYSKPQNNK